MDRRALIVIVLLILAAAGWGLLRPVRTRSRMSSDQVEVVTVAPTAVPGADPIPASTAPLSQADAVASIAGPSPSPVGSDPDVDSMLPPAEDARALHGRLAKETRDQRWAAVSERVARTAFASIPYIAGASNPLHVSCGASLCEVAGTLQHGVTLDNANVTLEAIQGKSLRDRMASSGLDGVAGTFGTNAAGDQTFVTYYKRTTR